VPQPISPVRRLVSYEWEASSAAVAAAAGIPESEVIRFDTNTAPWPPVAWEETVLDLPRLPVNEYPHPSNEPLRSAIATRLGVDVSQVIITAGADQGLYLVGGVFLEPGTKAVMADPSFAMFRVASERYGAEMVRVPVDERWDLPLGPLLDALGQPGVKLAWLCSPNNPTGRLIPEATVVAAAQAAPDVVLVLDEAYYEIAGVTLAHLLARFDNLVLLRTFSKGYGLAGARIGYLVGPPEIIAWVETTREPQNLSVMSMAAAYHALRDQAGLDARVAMIRAERARLEAELGRRGWDLVPSQGNFLLGRPPLDAAALHTWLQDGGLVLRSYRGHPRLNDWFRLTVRAPEENSRLLARLDAFRP
jgi:histidinol-phosphate aminotransferase